MKLNWFLRSVLREEAGDGATGGGGGSDSTALTVSGGTDLATTDDGAEGGGESVAITTTDADSSPIFEGGKLSSSASKTFRSLETANPQAKPILARAQRALGTVAKLTSMFGPKPFDAINRLRKLEREAGGEAGLKALREANDDLVHSDTLYEKADPQLIAMMTETPAAKQAFVKLFDHVVARVRDIAPKTYARFIGRQMIYTIEKLDMVTGKNADGVVTSTEPIDMPFRLRRVFTQLPPLDEHNKFVGGNITAEQQHAIHSDLAMIYSWIDTVRAWANSTPEDLTPPKEDTSAAAIAQAKADVDQSLQEAWVASRNAICNDILSEEVQKQMKGITLTSIEKANVMAAARRSVNDIRRAKPDNRSKQQAFLDAKDKKGYLAYNRKIFEDNAQNAVEKAISQYAKKSTRRAPAGAAGQQRTGTAAAGAPAGQQQQQTVPGKVVRLTAEQATTLGGRTGTRWIKHKTGNAPGTTTDMVLKGQQMLRAGNPLNLPEGTVVQFP